MSLPKIDYILPLADAWLVNKDGTRTRVKIITRRGGLYQVELPNKELKLALRQQLVKMTPHVKS